jgi:hypothetical protein
VSWVGGSRVASHQLYTKATRALLADRESSS